jgi:hypothetical protein
VGDPFIIIWPVSHSTMRSAGALSAGSRDRAPGGMGGFESGKDLQADEGQERHHAIIVSNGAGGKKTDSRLCDVKDGRRQDAMEIQMLWSVLG